jgi:TolB-like protein
MWFKSFIILFLITCSYASPAKALTLAIFPIEDLSQGQNGVNHELTEYLAWEMANDRGFDVIANETVLAFLARNRLRQLGFMDTKQIILAKEEMGADLVLFGTLSLRQEELSPSLGITLYLVRTNDTRTLWTGTGGLSGQDIVNLLAVGEEEERKGLMPRLAQDVLKTWPTELDFVSKEQHALEIEKIELMPTNVRRGDKVLCKVGLRSRWAEEDMPRVFFKASGRVYMAEQSPDGYTYQSDWLVADRDGRYPVTMVINWPSGYKKVAFLGAYVVDSAPPRIVLDLKGVQLQGTVAFRGKVIIIPRMLRREPIARRKRTVEDENGEEQMSYRGYGHLPKRFVWDGRAKSGFPAEEGIYRVSLKVWDRSENMAITSEPVAVARTPPSMVLEAKNRGREMVVDLSHEGKVPIAFWRMEMRSSNGELIKVAEGSDLPVRMDVSMPSPVIKVADGLRPPTADESKVIKVAEGNDGKKNLIKVAEGIDSHPPNRKVIKVAEGLTESAPNRKIIKVAEGMDNPVNKKIIKVAGGEPLIMDVARPEDQDTRKVECTVILRDILGNQVREKIEDLSLFIDEKEKEKARSKPASLWLDEF